MSETQPASKRPRVQDEEEDLGDSDSVGSGTENESGAEGEEKEAFRANDMIDLIFIEPDEQAYLAAAPQFTHQVSSMPRHTNPLAPAT
jgi:hypothetical protein